MNIKDLAPKHVNVDELRRTAPKYEGTEAELAQLVKDGVVTLLTNDEGTIIGINVHPSDNIEVDNAAKMNFEAAYSASNVMKWIPEIYSGEYEKRLAREAEAAKEADAEVRATATDTTVEVTDEEVERYGSVRAAVRHATGMCLARGSTPTIKKVTGGYVVSDIEYGRKLSASELAAM